MRLISRRYWQENLPEADGPASPKGKLLANGRLDLLII
jgi:hypothetical protein